MKNPIRVSLRRSYIVVAVCTSLLLFYAILKSTEDDVHWETENNILLIVVLTMNRPESLSRLLTSLANVHTSFVVDMHIEIDFIKDIRNQAEIDANSRCRKIAADFSWTSGKKTVRRRLKNVGLSLSWFEIPFSTNHQFVSILEDDMELSQNFFEFFIFLFQRGALDDSDVTGFCTHPGDWDINVHTQCAEEYSPILYLSPEPCNWGPIWKYREWEKFTSWVFLMKSRGELPFVPDHVAFEYNDFLMLGKDVQSSWVWRYNFEFGKTQVRYSFERCSFLVKELFLALNHKERGEHFAMEKEFLTDTMSLKFHLASLLHILRNTKLDPQPAPNYNLLSYRNYPRTLRRL
mmetsp:Transcript_2765/g.9695  ORF Transcript_2765/g.9695 Transcript_2765/m.9695 type:complete len:348 (+) Transcript_2765:142-1185(+)